MIPLLGPLITGAAGTAIATKIAQGVGTDLAIKVGTKIAKTAYGAWRATPDHIKQEAYEFAYREATDLASRRYNEWKHASPDQTEFDFGDETPVTYNYTLDIDDDERL